MELVIGGGAVGTALASYLQLANKEVLLQVKEEQVASYKTATEMVTTFSTGHPAIVQNSPNICVEPENWTEIERIYIAVKNRSLDEVLARLPKKLPRQISLIPCLNGVRAEEKIRDFFPSARMYPMIVMFNAATTTPLRVKFSTKPMILLDPHARPMAQLFSNAGLLCGPGSRALAWGKLLINLNNSICTLTRTTFKDVLVDPDLRKIMVATLDEAMMVLDRAQINYQLPFPAPAKFYRLGLKYAGPLLWWFAHHLNQVSDDSYPSMMSDVAKGVETEIDFLNGEICTLAQAHEIAAPTNNQLVELIKDLESGTQKTELKPAELRRILKIK